MSDLILNGPAPTTQNPHNVEGFLTKLTATDLATAAATANDYGRLHSLAVDGIHASKETEVMSIIGDETYRHSAGLYITGSGESGSELLMRRSAACMASTYVSRYCQHEAKAVLHAAGPNGGGAMRGDSVGGLWPTLEVIRDPLHESQSRCRAHVDFIVGCLYRVPIRSLQSRQHSSVVMDGTTEYRFVELRQDPAVPRTLRGVVVFYDKPSLINGQFYEQVARGAFGDVSKLDVTLNVAT